MSLLDKQEVQDICEDTALRAKNEADLYVIKRQKIRHYRARSTEERRRRRRRTKKKKKKKKKKNAKSRFFTPHGAYVNCAIIAMLYAHSIGNQP